MPRKSPLDELEALLIERRRKRAEFLAKFHSRISRAAHHRLFNYETMAVEREIELLETTAPERTLKWKCQLAKIKRKFGEALLHIENIAKESQKRDFESLSNDVFNQPSPNKPIKQIPLDIAETLLEIWGSASKLEKLMKEVEHEAARTLRERRATR